MMLVRPTLKSCQKAVIDELRLAVAVGCLGGRLFGWLVGWLDVVVVVVVL